MHLKHQYLHTTTRPNARVRNGILMIKTKTIKKLCSRLYSTEADLYSKNDKKSLFEPLFGNLGVTYTLRL